MSPVLASDYSGLIAIFGLLVGVGLLVVTAVVIAGIVIGKQARKRQDEQRGFEVNLNSGEELEAKKKENDHG